MERVDIPDFRFRMAPGKILRPIAFGVVILIFLFTSLYTVGPEELGVITRFGAFVRTTDPGLHLKIPFGMEKVVKIPVQRQLKEEFGFRTVRAGIRTEYDTRAFQEESLMLTGDLNAAQVEWVVQYRIVDAYKFLFRVRGVQDTFRAMTEAVIRRIIGDRTINEVLTVGRQEVATMAEEELQALCDQYETGIRVEQVVLQDVTPPDPVKPSFNEVNEAQQERERLINQALGDYNQVIPKARGEALQTIQRAEGYFIDRVNRARGDSARFNALFSAYMTAPEVTRTRVFLETMNEILPKVGRKIILDESVEGILPLLNLDTGRVSDAGPRASAGGEK